MLIACLAVGEAAREVPFAGGDLARRGDAGLEAPS